MTTTKTMPTGTRAAGKGTRVPMGVIDAPSMTSSLEWAKSIPGGVAGIWLLLLLG